MGIEKLYSLYGNTISKRSGDWLHMYCKRVDWDWFIVGISFYLGEVI